MRVTAMLVVLSWTTLVFAGAAIANSDALKQLELEIDDIASKSISESGPGCSVGIMRNQQFLFKKSYGLANVEHQVPISSNTVFRMASVSKQFTAFAVLLLADDGLINLQDDIRKHLPELKEYSKTVTINAMLGHFAGMGDYEEQLKVLDESDLAKFMLGNEDFVTSAEYYAVIKNLPLVQEPDVRQKYSNTAYFILSQLVERVSGMSLRKFADSRIFKPLGMEDTLFADDPEEVIHKRAYGYRTNEDGKTLTHNTVLFSVGDGGLFTSVEDMLIWDQHFEQPKLGKNPEALMALMNKPNGNFPATEEGRWFYANGQYTDGRYFSATPPDILLPIPGIEADTQPKRLALGQDSIFSRSSAY